MRASSLCLALVGLLACTPSNSKTTGERPQSEEGGSKSSDAELPAPDADLPTDPSPEVIAKVCAAPCAGDFARIEVYRDDEGRVARLIFNGDLEDCSHPPQVYFDAAGEETATIPEEPIEPGSQRATELLAKRDAELEGLNKAETLACPDPSRCEPERTKGFHSDFPCRTDSDCLSCACAPVNRPEYERRGASQACHIDGEECIATNPACCAGKCVLAR